MHIKVRIKQEINERWASWFEDLEITLDPEKDETLLSGEILDQAALYGLLAKLRDLGLSLLSVQVEDGAIQEGDISDGHIDQEDPPGQ